MVRSGLDREVDEPEERISPHLHQIVEDREHRRRVHHPGPEPEIAGDLPEPGEEIRQDLTPVQPPCREVLGGQLYLRRSVQRAPFHPAGDRICRQACQRAPGTTGDTVGAPAAASAGGLDHPDTAAEDDARGPGT